MSEGASSPDNQCESGQPNPPPIKDTQLIKYGTDLTSMAAEHKLDPVIGREEQIERVVQILCKRRKNNACLVGDPGVGKTVIAEGLAQRIVNATVPQGLQGKKIYSIDMGRLIAGTTLLWEFEERLNGVVDEVKQSSGAIILIIDELHNIIGAGAGDGQTMDAADILKPPLARGELKCIGATTRDEYKKYIEKDPAFKRRFQVVEVPEPSIEETINILRGLQSKYEVHHHVTYEDKALIALAKLSKQYIRDGFLPDKAIDLMDEAGSRVKLCQKKKSRARVNHVHSSSQARVASQQSKDLVQAAGVAVVTIDHIKQLISYRTGIPIEKVSQAESSRLLDMENILRKNIIGQEDAIKAVSRAIRRARVGISDPSRPIASFLFTGPTGVGKTQVAKLLAQEHMGSKEAMVRLDMSEYMEQHSIARLFGSPPGYLGHENGGQLTEAIRTRPHSIILLDEIDKAHVDVCNALLQILDDGRLTDGKGQVVVFKHTIIIMTSNIGFNSSSYDQEVTDEDVYKRLKQIFRPEFLNRLDEIIIFKKLEKHDLMKVLDVILDEVHERIKTKRISLEITKEFKEKLVLESCGGFNSNNYGARPLRRAITRLLEDELAEGILNGSIKEGDTLVIGNSQGEVLLSGKLPEKGKSKRCPPAPRVRSPSSNTLTEKGTGVLTFWPTRWELGCLMIMFCIIVILLLLV